MKLAELKNRLKHKYAIRMIAGVLVVTLVGTGTSSYVFAAKTTAESTKSAVEKKAGKNRRKRRARTAWAIC